MKAFLVRVWTPGDEVEAHSLGAVGLHGVVGRVGSEELTPFRDDDQLLELLRQSLRDDAPMGVEETRC